MRQKFEMNSPTAADRAGNKPPFSSSPGGPPQRTDSYPVVMVDVSALKLDGSPRLQGEDTEHTRLLTEVDVALPPILVHQETMRVIDGIHRVRATQIKGNATIAAQFYEGDEDAAFLLAVERNVAHGLPLSLADRKAAAARIVASHTNWSNRAIAASTGLSDWTVQTIRECSTAESSKLNARADGGHSVERIGRDGRVRPMNSAERRHRASQIIAEQPTLALRAVAEAAGISLGTAHDVRERMRRGNDPAPTTKQIAASSARLTEQPELNHAAMTSPKRDLQSIMYSLRRDPSLRFTDAGRRMLRWLHSRAIVPKDWERLLEGIPDHCAMMIAQIAHSSADAWRDFARELEQRGRQAG